MHSMYLAHKSAITSVENSWPSATTNGEVCHYSPDLAWILEEGTRHPWTRVDTHRWKYVYNISTYRRRRLSLRLPKSLEGCVYLREEEYRSPGGAWYTVARVQFQSPDRMVSYLENLLGL